MKENLQDLLSKYLDGTISQAEMSQLAQSTESAKDEDIASLLANEWEHYEKRDPDYNHFAQVDHMIRGNERPRINHFWETAKRVAAIFLLPISIGMAAYYYISTHQLENHVAQELTISVEGGERARMQLPDGSTVQLNSLSSISYPSNFGIKNRSIKLNGEAFFSVAKDSEHPFIVETSTLKIKVLGTEFNVNAYDNTDFSETALLKGSIEATTKGAQPQVVLLKPSEKLVLNKRDGTVTIEKTDLFYEMAWMTGELIFRSASLPEISSKLEQYYGVNINISGTGNQHETFTGSFNEDNIADVLKILQLHYDFEFQIKGSEVEIRFQ